MVFFFRTLVLASWRPASSQVAKLHEWLRFTTRMVPNDVELGTGGWDRLAIVVFQDVEGDVFFFFFWGGHAAFRPSQAKGQKHAPCVSVFFCVDRKSKEISSWLCFSFDLEIVIRPTTTQNITEILKISKLAYVGCCLKHLNWRTMRNF